MYYSNQYTDPTGSVEVDRALGKSYEVVKAVYNNINWIENYANTYTELATYDATLQKLNQELQSYSVENSTGVFIGHDQGRVGVEPERITFTGENFLSALTRSWDSLHIVSDNITLIKDLHAHLNSIKALSYLTKELQNLNKSCTDIQLLNANTESLKELLLYTPNLLILHTHINELLQIANKIKDVDELQDNLEIISNVNAYIHTLATLNSNIAIYEKANLNLKTYLEILEFRFEITNLSNHMADIQKSNELVEKQTTLVKTVVALDEIREELLSIYSAINDIHTAVINLDLIQSIANNSDVYSEIANNLPRLKQLLNGKDALIETIDKSNTNIRLSNQNIAEMGTTITQATSYIDNFLKNLPTHALITGQDNRTNVLLGSIKELDPITNMDKSWIAPSNGWFAVYFYGKSSSEEAQIIESIELDGIPVTLKIKKPCTNWDDSIQIYAVKDTLFKLKVSNLDSIQGKVQFIKEGTN